MANLPQIAKNDLARGFLFPSGVYKCGNPCWKYFPCLGVDGLAQDIGEPTRIECPDPYRYGQYIEIDAVPGEVSRLTTTLTTRMSRNEISSFRDLFKQGCNFDLQIHFGLCSRPDAFNEFDKALIFENVYVTSYGTDPLISLTSADRDGILETLDISVGNFYELVPLTYSEVGVVQSTAEGPFIDGLFVDFKTCGGECGTSDGCSDAFVINDEGTVVFTRDGGISWTVASDSFGVTDETSVGIDYLNGFVWVYTDDGTITYATKEDVYDGTNPTVLTGLTVSGVDQDSGSSYGLVVGTGGFIGYLTSPHQGFDIVHTGVTANDLNEVAFKPGTDMALIGGANGTLIYTENGRSFNVIALPVSLAAVTVTAVMPKSSQNWLVGMANGQLWCTDNGGLTWTLIWTGAATPITDIAFSTGHQLWLTQGNNLFRTLDGGCTWKIQPSEKRPLPTSGALAGVVPCSENYNFILGYGDELLVGQSAGS